jgi:hypothetical protein
MRLCDKHLPDTLAGAGISENNWFVRIPVSSLTAKLASSESLLFSDSETKICRYLENSRRTERNLLKTKALACLVKQLKMGDIDTMATRLQRGK